MEIQKLWWNLMLFPPLMIEFKYLFIYLWAIWISFSGSSFFIFIALSVNCLLKIWFIGHIINIYQMCHGIKKAPKFHAAFPIRRWSLVSPCLESGLVLWLAQSSRLWKDHTVWLFEQGFKRTSLSFLATLRGPGKEVELASQGWEITRYCQLWGPWVRSPWAVQPVSPAADYDHV